jgi:hypothetical protein
MKPSPNDRRGCEIVRDFLVGLAVFLTVFTLAMLDSRASRSAPAIVSKPAMAQKANGSWQHRPTLFTSSFADNDHGEETYALAPPPPPENEATPAPIKVVALERSLVRRMTHIAVPGVKRSRPGNQPLASEELPDNHPAGLVLGAREAEPFASGPDARGNSDGTSSRNTKLALISGKTGADSRAVPGASGVRGRSWIFIVMAFIFSAMTALTACLWRHLRLSVVPQRSGRRV